MSFQAGMEIGRVLASPVFQDGVATDDAALALVQQHLAPELRRFAGLMPHDHLGVRLEQAQELLRSRHHFAVDEPPRCLADRLTNQ
jgi:hypothetical protein